MKLSVKELKLVIDALPHPSEYQLPIYEHSFVFYDNDGNPQTTRTAIIRFSKNKFNDGWDINFEDRLFGSMH